MNSKKEEILVALVEEFTKGRKRSFSEILKLLSSDIINLAYRYTYNLEDAKDIFQEVSFKIFKHLKSFKKKAKFSTWVYRITVNSCIDFLRKRKDSLEIRDNLLESESYPQEIIDEQDKKNAIKEAIEKLPKAQKNVFILRHYQGLKISQISKILGCSQSTVKTHLARAIDNLRKTLEINKKQEIL
jgi:RNA polymerase sigma-70 factor (ECF subfamily)